MNNLFSPGKMGENILGIVFCKIAKFTKTRNFFENPTKFAINIVYFSGAVWKECIYRTCILYNLFA